MSWFSVGLTVNLNLSIQAFMLWFDILCTSESCFLAWHSCSFLPRLFRSESGSYSSQRTIEWQHMKREASSKYWAKSTLLIKNEFQNGFLNFGSNEQRLDKGQACRRGEKYQVKITIFSIMDEGQMADKRLLTSLHTAVIEPEICLEEEKPSRIFVR
jgi:hypothetical protein